MNKKQSTTTNTPTNKDTHSKAAVHFTHNILILGMLAKVYAELDMESPVHNWGASIPLRDVDCGGVVYTIGPHRRRTAHGDVLGVSVTMKPGKYGPNPGPETSWFIPIQALRSVSYTLDMVEVQ